MRRIPLSRRSHITGFQPVRQKAVEHESALERDFVLLTQFRDPAADLVSQPETIHFMDAGKPRRYTPDFLVSWSDGRRELIEIKYRIDLRTRWANLRPAFEAARDWAHANGATFRIATERGIRDEYGEPQTALFSSTLADDRLTLTRMGWDNPLGQPRANLQRVAYRLREGRLWRLHWPVLDRGSRMEPRETLLLDRVRDFKARFLDQGEWRDDWPPPASSSETSKPDPDRLPRAVEISLTLEDWGEITRLLPLPG